MPTDTKPSVAQMKAMIEELPKGRTKTLAKSALAKVRAIDSIQRKYEALRAKYPGRN